MPLEDRDKLSYAWNWFEYHAGQRLTAFRYFLIFLGILLVAVNNALQSGNWPFASVVAAMGAFVSLAFLVLEIRNEELVNVGRKGLQAIERSLIDDDEADLRLLSVDRRRSGFKSHKMWIRLIYLLCLVGFLVAAVDPSLLR